MYINYISKIEFICKNIDGRNSECLLEETTTVLFPVPVEDVVREYRDREMTASVGIAD